MLTLVLVFAASMIQLPGLIAKDKGPAPTAADSMQKLPLTASFEKQEVKEGGPQYVLHLKNDSKESLKVSAEVRHSVVVHNRPSTHSVPEHTLPAGKSWTIRDLASLDKVTVNAQGYAPLELVVP